MQMAKNLIVQGLNFETKNSFTKKFEHSKENTLLKHFSEFAKGIYETSYYNFFNFALIIVVFSSIVPLYYFYILLEQ